MVYDPRKSRRFYRKKQQILPPRIGIGRGGIVHFKTANTMQQPDDDRFIGVGEKTPEIDPNQTAIPSPEMVLEPTPSDLTDYLNANFVNKGGAVGGQWRGEHIWVEYGAGTIVIWNAKDMTYTHKTFGSADRDYIRRAIEWIKENKDVPQTSSEKAQKRTAELAEMWETNGRNPANQTENG